MIETEKFESPTLIPKTQRIKSNPQNIKMDRSWISSFANPTNVNKKNSIKVDKNRKITIKLKLLRSISARLEWEGGSSLAKEELKEGDTISMTSKMSRMSFESIRHSIY